MMDEHKMEKPFFFSNYKLNGKESSASKHEESYLKKYFQTAEVISDFSVRLFR